MRYLYSIVRYVPDTARGEFINVGIIAIADLDCLTPKDDFKCRAMRIVNNWNRASLLSGIEARKLEDSVGEALTIIGPPHSTKGLFEEHKERHGIIQYTAPMPAVGNSAHEVIDRLWPVLILETNEH